MENDYSPTNSFKLGTKIMAQVIKKAYSITNPGCTHSNQSSTAPVLQRIEATQESYVIQSGKDLSVNAPFLNYDQQNSVL